MKNTTILLAAALAAATPALCAQDEKKAAPGAVEMPNPRHGEHDALKALTGKWDVVMKTEAMPGVPDMEKATESKGTESAELICNGLWLKSVIDSTWKGEPWQGVWLAGYDPFNKNYVGHWVSSSAEECGTTSMNGSYDAKTRTWTWTGKTPHGDMRSVFKLEGADKTIETCYMTGPDGSEAKCMEITRTRSKSGKPGIVPASFSPKKPSNLLEEQQILLKDIGDWQAAVTAKYPGQDEPEEETATENVIAICHGRWLWSDFKGQFQGQPFEGHALFGYDPNEKKYVSFWFDSCSAVCSKTTGTYDESKKTYNLTGKGVDPAGKPMSIKQVLTWQDDDTRHLKMEFVGEETHEMEILYKRKAQR